MSENIVYVYPRGFLSEYTNSAPSGAENTILTSTAGVLVQYIDGIYGIEEAFTTKNISRTETVLKSITLASKLFGANFNTWLALQLTSPTISAECLSFIEDTVSFIKTGKRIIAVEASQRIIQDVERDRYNTEQSKYVCDLSFEDFNTVSVLCDWIAQPNGLLDLRYSLEIMYGDERLVERSLTIQPKPGAMHF